MTIFTKCFVTRQIACHWINAKKYCTAVAASVDSARDVVYTYNPLRAYVSPEPFSSRATPSRVSLPLAPARGDRPVAATARTSCSWSISEARSPMPLTAAADASRGREQERKRETQWLNAVSAIRRTARASIGSVRTARSRCSEEGGWSANYCTAGQFTHSRPAIITLSPTAVPRAYRGESSA